MLLELRSSLDFSLSFPYSLLLLLQVLIPQGCISFHLENSQLETLLIIILLEFEYSFNGLYQIKVILQFEITTKLRCLNLEVTKIISWMPSFSNTPIIIMFMRRWVGKVNGINIRFLIMRASVCGSFNPLKLHGGFSYSLLKIDNGLISPHLMGLFKWNVSRLRRFFFIGHC